MAEKKEIGGHRILRTLGKGGMGTVYEAVSPDGAARALKLFSSTGSHADFLRKRFVAEGKILSRLVHPRLVQVYEHGVDDATGAPYFTMDLVVGPDGSPCPLEDLRRRGGLEEAAVAAVYGDLRSALGYLHANGVVHRDVKLENVLIDAEGRAVLSDFGVSRILNRDLRAEIAVTTTFASDRAPIMGSAGYLSPELKTGAAATPADDAWALGVLVFRLLTGVWYEADSSAMDLVAGMDPGWRRVLCTLLHADPARRLPFPEMIPGRSSRRRNMQRFCWAAAVLALLAVFCVSAFWRSTGPAYDFDEFFPEQSGREALSRAGGSAEGAS